MACPECGKLFPSQKKMTRHKKIHQTKDSPTSPKVVQKVKSIIGFGTFLTTEKESTPQEFLCAQCSKICRDSHNLERHMRLVHLKRQKKKKENRTNVMRKVLSDEGFLRSTESDQDGNFSCNECKYVTNNRNYLTDHEQRMYLIQDGIWLCSAQIVHKQPQTSKTPGHSR